MIAWLHHVPCSVMCIPLYKSFCQSQRKEIYREVHSLLDRAQRMRIQINTSKPLYTIKIVSFLMKRLFLFALVVISLFPVQGGSNITLQAVSLDERVVLIKFINMGVDAYWSSHILANAASALPVLEDLIGVPLPEEIESIEIYGEKSLGMETWMVGYNSGHLVKLEKDHPDPTIIFHELVHFWTIHYNIPWPLAEGYCDLYADLCARQLGLNEVAVFEVDWESEYYNLQNHRGKTPLNNLNYMSSKVKSSQREYFYLASGVIMFNFYEKVGEENMKHINVQLAQSDLNPDMGGFGIVQYLKIVKEVTGANYAHLFMPVILAEWEPEQEDAFVKAVGRYCAVSALTQTSDIDEQMKLALGALANGRFQEFHTSLGTIIDDYYAELRRQEEEQKEQVIEEPVIEEEGGLLHNRLFMAGIAMLAVVVILLIYSLSRIAKEEEEFEWEVPESGSKEPGYWVPPQQRPTEEITEELPELPDLEELTK